MSALEFLFQSVDLFVTETRAISLQFTLQSQPGLIVVRSTGYAASVTVVASAVRLVRVSSAFEFDCERKNLNNFKDYNRANVSIKIVDLKRRGGGQD